LDPRPAAAVIAAFRTSGNGGFIPHARHGGKGKEEVALVESKFDGTGLEKEQIGQTQVPVDFGDCACTEADLKGLLVLVTGEDEEDSVWTDLGLGPSSRGRGEPKPSFNALG
jgi:hypothetical protein